MGEQHTATVRWVVLLGALATALVATHKPTPATAAIAAAKLAPLGVAKLTRDRGIR